MPHWRLAPKYFKLAGLKVGFLMSHIFSPTSYNNHKPFICTRWARSRPYINPRFRIQHRLHVEILPADF